MTWPYSAKLLPCYTNAQQNTIYWTHYHDCQDLSLTLVKSIIAQVISIRFPFERTIFLTYYPRRDSQKKPDHFYLSNKFTIEPPCTEIECNRIIKQSDQAITWVYLWIHCQSMWGYAEAFTWTNICKLLLNHSIKCLSSKNWWVLCWVFGFQCFSFTLYDYLWDWTFLIHITVCFQYLSTYRPNTWWSDAS